MTRRISARAIALRQLWLAEGAPGIVTLHEAHRLSGGRAGREGDHSTPISLAALALLVARQEAGR